MGKKQHFVALDGLRGIAALVVVLSHSAKFLRVEADTPQPLFETVTRMTVHFSQLAVILFFVLSGFVLYVAFSKRPGTPYGSYLVRRVFRLYPAILATIVIAIILRLALAPAYSPGLEPQTNASILFPLDPVVVVRHVLLLGVSADDIAIAPVLWSLAVEMRFSILFVGLALLCRRSPWALAAVALAAWATASALIDHLGLRGALHIGETTLGALALTLYYLPGFCFGIIAADLMLRASAAPLWTVLGLAAGLVGVAMLTDDKTAWSAAFAAVIYHLARPGLATTVLAAPPVKFLGDISYSLYLIHYPILRACMYLLQDGGEIAMAAVVAPVLSIGVAALMYRYVEKPGMQFGARLLNRPRAISA